MNKIKIASTKNSREFDKKSFVGTAIDVQFLEVRKNELGFNLSNGVTDTLESSSVLIYLIWVKGIYTHKVTLIKTKYKEGIMAKLIKQI
jgi:hypothetical protein